MPVCTTAIVSPPLVATPASDAPGPLKRGWPTMRSGPRTICACAVTVTKTSARESFMPASPRCAPPRRDDATDEDAIDVAVFEAFVGDRLGRERRRGECDRQRIQTLH